MTLEQRLSDGDGWSRRQWAEARLAQHFSKRIPANVSFALAKAISEAEQYVATYNIWMHHLIDDSGQRQFPAGMRLLEHWNLRDEIRAGYSEGTFAMPRQRMIARVMERIIDQTIPNAVVDNPAVDWNPFTNAVSSANETDSDHVPTAQIHETDSRYAM